VGHPERGDELVNALAKVRSFIPTDRATEIEVKANQVYIDLTPWMGNRNIKPYLEIIKTALQESRLLRFEYADRYGNRTVRTAEPYQLILKGNHWYWQGYCHQRHFLSPGNIKNRSWILPICWQPCTRKLKFVFTIP
jgi:predicted DNA-binding transcriptional regulator YafY